MRLVLLEHQVRPDLLVELGQLVIPVQPATRVRPGRLARLVRLAIVVDQQVQLEHPVLPALPAERDRLATLALLDRREILVR